MYAKKQNDRKIDIKHTLQFLGMISPNLYLAQNSMSPDKKTIVKVIPLPTESPQAIMQQEAIIRKVCSGSMYYLKP